MVGTGARSRRVEGGRDGRGGLHGGDLLLLLGLLGDAQLLFHLEAELVGGAAELAHQLADLAREFGQLLRTEEQECQQKIKALSPSLA